MSPNKTKGLKKNCLTAEKEVRFFISQVTTKQGSFLLLLLFLRWPSATVKDSDLTQFLASVDTPLAYSLF